jgi:4-hydroxy-3-methylbut-2-enyl diphosphate reductase
MVTAHGICELERLRLIAAGYRLIDTTCPLVKRAHDAARALEKMGCLVLVIGRRGHVEVDGITGNLRRFEVVESVGEVRRYDERRIGIVCQTTTPPALANEIVDRIRFMNGGSDIQYAATICRPTLDRQAAVRSLLNQVEALVVVGGIKSNNTRQLAEMARNAGKPCTLVQGADELDPAWLNQFESIGLTAGTSTPDKIIEDVYRRLLAIAADHEPEPFRQAI